MAMKIKLNLIVKNEFSFPVSINIIDELPEQFQDRKWKRHLYLKEKQQKKIQYYLRPCKEENIILEIFICLLLHH